MSPREAALTLLRLGLLGRLESGSSIVHFLDKVDLVVAVQTLTDNLLGNNGGWESRHVDGVSRSGKDIGGESSSCKSANSSLLQVELGGNLLRRL